MRSVITSWFIEQLSDGLEKDEIILYAFVLMPRVGEYFGYRGNGAVGKQRGRLKKLLDVDDRLKK